MSNPTPDKLAEARERIQNWEKFLSCAVGWCPGNYEKHKEQGYPEPCIYDWSDDEDNKTQKEKTMKYIKDTLLAQDLVSRAEQKEKDAEVFRKNTEGLCHAACNKPLQLGYIYEKLLDS